MRRARLSGPDGAVSPWGISRNFLSPRRGARRRDLGHWPASQLVHATVSAAEEPVREQQAWIETEELRSSVDLEQPWAQAQCGGLPGPTVHPTDVTGEDHGYAVGPGTQTQVVVLVVDEEGLVPPAESVDSCALTEYGGADRPRHVDLLAGVGVDPVPRVLEVEAVAEFSQNRGNAPSVGLGGAVRVDQLRGDQTVLGRLIEQAGDGGQVVVVDPKVGVDETNMGAGGIAQADVVRAPEPRVLRE